MTEYSNELPINNENLNNSNVENNQVNPSSVFNNMMNQPTNNEAEQVNEIPTYNNKFFNNLEDEPASLNNLDPFSTNPSFTMDSTNNSTISSNDDDIEIFDMPTTPTTSPIVEEPIKEENVEVSQTMNELNPNNKFFTPVNDEPAVNIASMESNATEAVVNPMDFVDKIDIANNIEENIALPNAITKIRNLVQELNNSGLKVKIEEADLDNNYQLTIEIEK